MKLLFNCIVSALMLVTTQAFAAQFLSYPVDQSPECNQSYEDSPEPKSMAQVLSALNQVCRQRGGERVINKALAEGNSSEPADVFCSCIGENPVDYVIFYCTYGIRDVL